MARSKVTYKHNYRAWGQLMTGTEARALVRMKAEAVATMANVHIGQDGGHDVIDATTDRARFVVRTATDTAKRGEATDRSLTRAIGAARG